MLLGLGIHLDSTVWFPFGVWILMAMLGRRFVRLYWQALLFFIITAWIVDSCKPQCLKILLNWL